MNEVILVVVALNVLSISPTCFEHAGKFGTETCLEPIILQSSGPNVVKPV
jgi:hypothetical protein